MSTKIATIVIGDVKTEDKVMKGLFFSELDEFHLTPCNDKKIPIKIWTTNHEEYDATEITAELLLEIHMMENDLQGRCIELFPRISH